MSSLTRNTLANYASLIYTTLIGLIMLGQYIQFLGEEAYGLIGFFTLMQTWLSLLTVGIGPTLSRQVAYYRGKKELWKTSFKKMLRSIEIVVLFLAILIAILVWASRYWIASEWLHVKEIPIETVALSLTLMGIITALRWNITLYTSGISGMERQVWLSGFNTLMTTIRYGAGYIQLSKFSNNIINFFILQIIITTIELIAACIVFYRTQSKEETTKDPGLYLSLSEIKSLAPFLISIGYTSAVWTLITQTDKLILSHALPLKEFGYLTIVTLISNGILRFSEPISTAILPRMAFYYSKGDIKNLTQLYKNSTQLISVITFSIVGVVILYSESIIYLLTNKLDAATWGSPILMWFTIGNGILIISGMQYSLQFSYGNLRLHVINSTINIFLQVPLMAYAAYYHGALAVSIAWTIFRLTIFVVYPAIVHYKLVPGLHSEWMAKDIGLPLCGVTIGAAAASLLTSPLLHLTQIESKLHITLIIIISGLVMISFGALASPSTRKIILSFGLKYLSRFSR